MFWQISQKCLFFLQLIFLPVIHFRRVTEPWGVRGTSGYDSEGGKPTAYASQDPQPHRTVGYHHQLRSNIYCQSHRWAVLKMLCREIWWNITPTYMKLHTVCLCVCFCAGQSSINFLFNFVEAFGGAHGDFSLKQSRPSVGMFKALQ